MTEERETAGFEKWCLEEMHCYPEHLFRRPFDGQYDFYNVRTWWVVWQAARREERKRTLEECAATCENFIGADPEQVRPEIITAYREAREDCAAEIRGLAALKGDSK